MAGRVVVVWPVAEAELEGNKQFHGHKIRRGYTGRESKEEGGGDQGGFLDENSRRENEAADGEVDTGRQRTR